MPPLSPFSKSCLAVAIAQTFSIQAAHAATITVDSLTDNGTNCTLREAIANTNAGTNQSNGCTIVGTLGTSDTIDFDSGLIDGIITLTGGQLDITDDVVINGSNITINANIASRAMHITGGTVSLNELAITNGSDVLGGGIYASASSVSLSNCTITGNSVTSKGGGIFAISNTTINMYTSTLSGNSSGYKGGGIYAFSGITNINNSTLSGNSAVSSGGGIAVRSGNIVSLSNSTVSGNSGFSGGGIYTKGVSGSIVSLYNSTVSGNSATNYGGGIMIQTTTSLNLSNSIVAGNSASVTSEIHNNGTITADNNNLFGHSGLSDTQAFDSLTIGASDINTTSDGTSVSLSNILNPLEDNGGDTFTHALVVGSPAIDASGAGATATDQRGFNAINTRDIGAFEFGSIIGLDLTVTSLLDNGSNCTLREAIDTTNALSNLSNGCFNIGTPDNPSTIKFDNALSDGSITLVNSQLNITQDVVINGLNNTIDAGLASRVMHIKDSTVSLNQLILTNGLGLTGGGFYARSSNVNLSNSTLTGNSAPKGAGIYAKNNSSLSLNNSSISNNSASTSGGGFYTTSGSSVSLSNSTVSGNSAQNGGGMLTASNSSVTLNNSTVSDNLAYRGGGMFPSSSSRVTLNNSTVSNNSATHGGGINSNSESSVTLNNSTVSGNTATNGGGMKSEGNSSITLNNSTVSGNSGSGIIFFGTSSITINNSIVAGNITKEIGAFSTNYATSNGNNLFGHIGLTDAQAFSFSFTPEGSDINATSDGGDLPTAITSILDITLADNGGSTLTHALVANSPAIDAADDTLCAAAPINGLDQRGRTRPSGACDIGSFEVDDDGFFVIPIPGNKAVVVPSG